MKLKQCIGVMVAFSLLLLNCIEMGWAEEKPVFDDDGNINLRVLHLWMMK